MTKVHIANDRRGKFFLLLGVVGPSLFVSLQHAHMSFMFGGLFYTWSNRKE